MMYLHDPACRICHGTGTIERLSKCCGNLSPFARDCGCNGWTVDAVEPCACARPASTYLPRTVLEYVHCPACEGWGRRVYVYASREVYPGGSFPSEDYHEVDCDACKGSGYRRARREG